MKIGIQISSLAKLLTNAENVKSCVRKLKEMGYNYTQLQWISPTVTAKEIGRILSDADMVSLGTQEKYDACAERLNDFIDINREAGSNDICFSTIPERYFENGTIRDFADEMNRHMERLDREGMQASFHPTKGDFRILNGKYACDLLFEMIPSLKIVADINQLMRAGVDAGKWILKHKGRIETVHFKDSVSFEDGSALTPVGKGKTDFVSLIPYLEKAGVEYALAEQEKWEGDPFDAMRESFDYMKGILK